MSCWLSMELNSTSHGSSVLMRVYTAQRTTRWMSVAPMRASDSARFVTREVYCRSEEIAAGLTRGGAAVRRTAADDAGLCQRPVSLDLRKHPPTFKKGGEVEWLELSVSGQSGLPALGREAEY